MYLPDFLINKYNKWKQNEFPKNSNLLSELEKKGQNPKAMIISCCDSRVNPNIIFKGVEGDYFISRNIANLVPSSDAGPLHFATSSAIDYAISSLKISNLIILGHSNCGGIKHAYEFFSKNKQKDNSSINNWIETIRPAYEILDKNYDKKNILQNLEKLSIQNSISNLHSFPKIKNLILNKKLNVYGLWFEIKSGNLMLFEDKKNIFVNIN